MSLERVILILSSFVLMLVVLPFVLILPHDGPQVRLGPLNCDGVATNVLTYHLSRSFEAKLAVCERHEAVAFRFGRPLVAHYTSF